MAEEDLTGTGAGAGAGTPEAEPEEAEVLTAGCAEEAAGAEFLFTEGACDCFCSCLCI